MPRAHLAELRLYRGWVFGPTAERPRVVLGLYSEGGMAAVSVHGKEAHAVRAWHRSHRWVPLRTPMGSLSREDVAWMTWLQ